MKKAIGEIYVVPFFGQGHVFPCTELCKKLSFFNFKTTLILSSDISSSVSSSVINHRFVNVASVDAPLPPPPPRLGKFDPKPMILHFEQMNHGTKLILTKKVENDDDVPIVCAVVDSMMLSHVGNVFNKFQVPIVSYFTCGSACLAMDYAAWKADVEYLKSGETQLLPGLPDEMAMDYVDIVRRFSLDEEFGKVPNTKKKSFPTQPGDEPPWVEEDASEPGIFQKQPLYLHKVGVRSAYISPSENPTGCCCCWATLEYLRLI